MGEALPVPGVGDLVSLLFVLVAVAVAFELCFGMIGDKDFFISVVEVSIDAVFTTCLQYHLLYIPVVFPLQGRWMVGTAKCAKIV
jgi:hypothetical protein